MIYATTEKVCWAWLANLPALSAAMVGGELPSDNSTWAASGFITTAGAGGVPDVHLPVAHPVLMLSHWAVDPNTGLPPWQKAANLAETVRAATNSPASYGAVLDVPNSDQRAKVLSAYLIAEPRRSYGDLGDYAAVVSDLHLDWVALDPA